ncbi:hypothetical protein BKA56DRAFT_606196 [Ilyonectria sp. MPI-CAGE-AT-0026]|nr:hypothetical protein BKA56DRAFT_606196 [Ilyonectria sp. MPI-CAGE-AT-0026]
MPSLTNIESNFLAFDSTSNLLQAHSIRIESTISWHHPIRFASNRMARWVRSKIDRFGRTSAPVC